jgi:hypothetical protein
VQTSVPLLCSEARPDSTGQSGEEVFRSPEYSSTHGAFYERVFFPAEETSVKFNPAKWVVQRSGWYVLRVVVCSQTLVTPQRPITMDGQVQYVNPYGYLPADLYGYMPFWFWMLIAHVTVGAVWLLLSLRNWRDLLHLQMCISGILFVSMVETCAWNFIFESYNDNGRMPLIPSVGVEVINTGKRTLSRMLVLVVSMGYGVVKPTLGIRGRRVVLLGLVYFIFATPLAIIDWVRQSPDIGVGTRLIFVLPVAAMDSGFSVWIFSELSATVAQLEGRNQRTKLQVYRRFTRIVAALIVVSVAWSSYELYVIGSHAESVENDNRWKGIWRLEAMWPFLYFVVLISTMWLWAPSKNAVRYAYSEEIGRDDDEYYDDSDQLSEQAGHALELRKPTLEVGGNYAVPADEHTGRTDVVQPTAEAKVLAIATGNQGDGDVAAKMN